MTRQQLKEEKPCRHIFETIGAAICPDCGGDTHETDWQEQNRLHRQWIADGKADWNICPLGGTIRGWWSI
jgi:hypothetical protein